MRQTHRVSWTAGLAGMFAGSLLVIGGLIGPTELRPLIGGYGVMLVGSAVFLLAGLKLRDRIVDYADAVRVRRAATARLASIPTPSTSTARSAS